MKKLKSIDWKDLGQRALKTFIQAFVAGFAVDSVAAAGNFDTLKAALVGATVAAAAAGVSAVMNLIGGLVKTEKKDDSENE